MHVSELEATRATAPIIVERSTIIASDNTVAVEGTNGATPANNPAGASGDASEVENSARSSAGPTDSTSVARMIVSAFELSIISRVIVVRQLSLHGSNVAPASVVNCLTGIGAPSRRKVAVPGVISGNKICCTPSNESRIPRRNKSEPAETASIEVMKNFETCANSAAQLGTLIWAGLTAAFASQSMSHRGVGPTPGREFARADTWIEGRVGQRNNRAGEGGDRPAFERIGVDV
jgi:hypothetical protein